MKGVSLRRYSPQEEGVLIPFVIAFWKTHHATTTEEEAKEDIAAWSARKHQLFMIDRDGQAVGFLHLYKRGPNVCWVEDVFVEEVCRGQGIASAAIRMAEEAMRGEGVDAMCMDVVPDNLPALRLYRRLGYDRLSLVTVRKEFEPYETAREEKIAGLVFRVKKF